MHRHPALGSIALSIALTLAAAPARALPEAKVLLADLGFQPDEIAKVEAGEFVNGSTTPSTPRELVAAFAFRVDAPPAKLAEDLRAGLLTKVDPTITAAGEIHGAGSLADFAKLGFGADAAKRATAYTSGSSDLNLSAEEAAAFAKLSDPSAVEQQVRAALLARVQAYRAKGLAGIAPYVRGSGTRSAADELRAATKASNKLANYAPAAHALVLGYPAGKPADLAETFRWTQFDAHGVPTIALVHSIIVADGDARLAMQRQYYVSTGYNCEQAVAAFLPTGTGTIVVYSNRTSTDQVTGIGGGTKRSIGSRMLESQLEGMFQKIQSKEQ